MSYFMETMDNLLHQTAFFNLTVGNFIMILVACVFLYLAIAKGFEPLLLVPIAFGMLLVNIYPRTCVSLACYQICISTSWAICESTSISIGSAIRPSGSGMSVSEWWTGFC